MYGIIICPAIEVGWLDILLAQQSGYLRTMIDGVVDGLDHYDDDRGIIGSPVKMEDLTQLPLLHERDQRFSDLFARRRSSSKPGNVVSSFSRGVGDAPVIPRT